jgi:hypothetical protein
MAKSKSRPKPPFDVSVTVLRLTGGIADPAFVLETLAGLGLSEEIAAVLLDLEPSRLAELLADPQLGRAWRRGRHVADCLVTNALLQSAIEGDTVAQRFWLINRLPEVFSTRGLKTKVAGKKPDEAEPLRALKVVG